MPIKDIVIGFLHGQKKLLLENTEISESTRDKRLNDIHRLIGEWEEKKRRWNDGKKAEKNERERGGNHHR